MEVRKAIIPLAGMGTRFLPLSKVVPKDLWPLAGRPMIEKIIREAKESGINQIIFVISPGNKKIIDYLKPSPKIEKNLKEKKREELLKEYKEFEQFVKSISFSYVIQKNPQGDGHAILQAAKEVKKEPVACLFSDDIIESKTPCLAQLQKIFKTCQKPVLSLYPVSENRIPSYGIAGVEKIANRYYKVKEIIEKPSAAEAPSNLALVGKYILTPEVFEYLKKAKPNEKKEIILADTLSKMLRDGKMIYGHEIEGKWLECGDKKSWMKSNLYFSLKDPELGPEMESFLREIK